MADDTLRRTQSPSRWTLWAVVAVVAGAGLVEAVGSRAPQAPSGPAPDVAVVAAFGADRIFAWWTESRGTELPPVSSPPWYVVGSEHVGETVLFARGTPPPTPDGIEIQPVRRIGPWQAGQVRRAGEGDGGAVVRTITSRRIDLDERIRGADVRIVNERGETRRACDRWRFGRWVCGPNDWNWVGPVELPVRGRQQECLWAHPTDEGSLAIAFGDVPPARYIGGRVAFSDEVVGDGSTRRHGDDDGDDAADEDEVSLTVLWNGEEIGRREVTLRRGWQHFRYRVDRGGSDDDDSDDIESDEAGMEEVDADEAEMEDVGPAVDGVPRALRAGHSVETLAGRAVLAGSGAVSGSGARAVRAAPGRASEGSGRVQPRQPSEAIDGDAPHADSPGRVELRVESRIVGRRHLCIRPYVELRPEARTDGEDGR